MWEEVYYLDMIHTWYSKVCYMKHKSFHSHAFILAPALNKNCSYLEFFWSVFSRVRTEYEEIRISSYLSECGKIRTRKTLNKDTFHAVLIG